ncbi:hypothetical protein PRZ48_003798 [Zasmidium cellare]|uniref:Uncharacterized protein n=1 Tax=Zasmidium cellare TaxID=395010 RepID=A0ABR0EXD3_ZASCE|nr:hypothetical protein PRZ48_003798 [Zasmidium cellare]
MTSKSSYAEPEATENASPKGSPFRKAKQLSEFSPTKGSLPASPSLPEFRSHVRTNSDVQGLVKRFEHLDVRDRDAEIAERSKKHELELRRAQIAREEAESDVRRMREEIRRLKREGDEGRDRERKVIKRLEVVTEEFTTFKDSHASQSSVYEKEVRKARKEAFKSSSEILKLKEELKSMRSTLNVAQSNLDMEKRKIQVREQQTFDAQYQLVAVQEELEKFQARMKIVEEEKEALKTSLKEEEVARIAAEGMIALPGGSQDDDLLSSPKRRSPGKRQPSPFSDDKENVGVVTKKMLELKRLEEQLEMEKIKREHAEELADFLRMECRFQCCNCQSTQPGHDEMLGISNAFAEAMENIRKSMRDVLCQPLRSDSVDVAMDENKTEIITRVEDDEDVEMEHAPEEAATGGAEHSFTMADVAPVPEHIAIPEAETPKAPHPTPIDPELEAEDDIPEAGSTTKVPLAPSSPQTPGAAQPPTPFHQQRSVRTITHTTTIPMHFTPVKPSSSCAIEDAEVIPPTPNPLSPRDRSGSAPTFDRAAALAAIAYRRGRAKSIANGHVTPRKQMIEGVSIKERRDISAPALGQQKTAGANHVKSSATVGRGAASAKRLA